MELNQTPIDYSALIQSLGGPKDVAKDLGMPEVGFRTVYFWWYRNSVPAQHVPAILSLAIARKVITSIEDAPRVDPFAAPDLEPDT